MSVRINDVAPDFTAETTQGTLRFHEWIGDGWAVLFSHPKDFTPVCTTELGAMAGLQEEFAARGAKIIGLSLDPVESHAKWAQDIEDVGGFAVRYPMIACLGNFDAVRSTPATWKAAAPPHITPPSAPCSSSGRTSASSCTSPTP